MGLAASQQLRELLERAAHSVHRAVRILTRRVHGSPPTGAARRDVRSFEGVRDRASLVDIGGVTLVVASLADIIRSKKAAGRPRDLAVLEILERALEEASWTTNKARGTRTRK
jgi:hypothetical protein